jgi:polyferredoxin
MDQNPADLFWMKYLLWPPFLLFALWWLVLGGRGEGLRGRYSMKTFRLAMLASVLVFGFALGRMPNPVETFLGVFSGAGGGAQSIGGTLLLLLFFTVLALVGNKLICGWGCPFGALQEFLYSFPLARNIKAHQLPFIVTHPVRTLAVFIFVLPLFGLWGGASLYGAIDPFRLFDLDLVRVTVIASLGILLLLSLFVYRPFCQLLCPFGWYSWFFERFSLYGVRIRRDRCTRCNACSRACPLEAARGRVIGAPMPADCFSCARCLRVCHAGAIKYGVRSEE